MVDKTEILFYDIDGKEITGLRTAGSGCWFKENSDPNMPTREYYYAVDSYSINRQKHVVELIRTY